jgi:histidinol-phosphate aminotransferase
VASSVTEIADSFFRPSVQGLVPYEPGKPVEEVQRELGLARCVKLASNEGPFGPFPAALEALARSVQDLNRYPDGGVWRLRTELAERLGVAYEEVAVGAGADGLIDCLSQASLDPGEEVVCGWPSFPSYVIDAAKQGAVAIKVPLRDHRYDLDAMLEAITPRTNLVYVCHPNNPTGTTNTREELDAFLDRVPANVLVVIDQAYREYIDDPDYPDAIEEYFKAGRPVAVLRTFSKIYGLAGLRVGYMVAQPAVVTAVNKVKRAFDVSTAAQEAALASLDAPDEIARRRALNAEARDQVAATLAAAGFEVAGPAVANFVYAETGADTRPLFEALLAQGAIVRPLHGFGSDTAIRVTAGTPDENAFFADALARVRNALPAR